MARSFAALSLILSAAALLAAEERPPADPLAGATPKPEANREPRHEGRRSFPGGGDPQKAREFFQQMSPEDRQKWMERFKEFADMPPEKRRELLDRGEMFRRKMREDIETAISATGLTLSEEQKKKFAERYGEERRKIEEELRRELDEKRRPKVQALIEKLKQEFAP